MNNLLSTQSVALVLGLIISLNTSAYGQLPSDQLFRKGYYYLSVDETKAIEYLTQAIERDSSRAKYFYYRGIAKFKQGNYELSLSDFEKSIELDTTMKVTYMYQGMALKNLDRFNEAEEKISQFIENNGSDASGYAYIVRGKTRLAAGDVNGAIEDFTLVTEEYPEDDRNNYYRLVALGEKGDYSTALQEANRLIDDDPNFYGYYFFRANLFFKTGKYNAAINDYTTSIAFNENNADAYYQRGMVLDTLKRRKEAIKDYSVAISINGSDGTYFSKRGNARFSTGDKAGACLDWTIAGSLGYYEDYEKVKQVCDQKQ